MSGTSYKAAGVDIDAGNETVRRIKSIARGTFTPGVLVGDRLVRRAVLDGVGRLDAIRCSWRAPMASAPSSRWRSWPACTTRSAATS